MRIPSSFTAAVAALCAAAALPAAAAAATVSGPTPEPGVTRPAILVGNNWDGTTDVVDPETFERLDRIDVVPDRAERMAEVMVSPDRFGFFLGVRNLVGEGHDQLNDDVFSSNDGRTLFVSRPSFADVVAIDLATKRLRWRFRVAGYRADHMAISADGTRLLVSASTGNVVHELDTATGREVGRFPSGDSPHENVYSKDGTRVFHANIGRVYLPFDREPVNDAAKGAEFFQVVDARTNAVLERIDMGKELAEAGFEGMSGAVRPMALSPDERFVFFQVSFHHGFVEYDLQERRVVRVARLPLSEEAARLQREQYLLDSAHHGLAMDPTGRKLCVAGTMSDYAAIVDRRTFVPRLHAGVEKPYWSTNSGDGRHCYVSASQADEVVVIDYESEDVVHRFDVGRHPQRVRNGVVRVAQYPQGKHGEAFRLETFMSRQPLSVRAWDEDIGCRAAGAERLRLVRCRIELRTRPRRGARSQVVAAGERVEADRRSFAVDVDFHEAGKALLRRHRRGVRLRLVARGVDSVGRVQRVAHDVRVRRR